jgi:hypothetical protein
MVVDRTLYGRLFDSVYATFWIKVTIGTSTCVACTCTYIYHKMLDISTVVCFLSKLMCDKSEFKVVVLGVCRICSSASVKQESTSFGKHDGEVRTKVSVKCNMKVIGTLGVLKFIFLLPACCIAFATYF